MALPVFKWVNFSDNTTGSQVASFGMGVDRANTSAGSIGAGDVLIGGFFLYNPNPAVTISAPSGWTQIGSPQYDGGNLIQSGFYWHQAGSTETPPYTFGWSSPNLFYSWILACYSGADTVSPVDGAVGLMNTNGTGTVTISTTLASSGDLLVLITESLDLGGSTTTWSISPSMTTQKSPLTGPQFTGFGYCSLQDSGPQSSGSVTETITVNAFKNIGYAMLGLKAGSGGGGGGGTTKNLTLLGVG